MTWVANIIQVLIIAALAGKTVGLSIPGFGEINITDGTVVETVVETPKEAEKLSP